MNVEQSEKHDKAGYKMTDVSTALTEAAPSPPLTLNSEPKNEIPVFDTVLALEWIDGDVELLLMTLPIVRNQTVVDRQEIANAISENDTVRVKKVSHRLKGSVGQIGAVRAQNACQLLEAAAAKGDSSAFAKLQFELCLELDALTPAIDSFLANQATNSN